MGAETMVCAVRPYSEPCRSYRLIYPTARRKTSRCNRAKSNSGSRLSHLLRKRMSDSVRRLTNLYEFSNSGMERTGNVDRAIGRR